MTMLFYLSPCYQLDATVSNGCADEDPVLDETEPPEGNQDLTTIDTDTLNRLCEEIQPAENS